MRPDRSGLIRVENERYALALYRAFTCQLVRVFRFGFSKFSKFSIDITLFLWYTQGGRGKAPGSPFGVVE